MSFIRLLLVFCAVFGLPRMRAFSITCIVTLIFFFMSNVLGIISIIAFVIMSFKCYIFADESWNKFNFRGYDDRGYNKKGYNINGYDMQGYNKKGYDKAGFDKDGWNKLGINKVTKTKYDKYGWSKNGENEKTGTIYGLDGYTQSGIDVEGFNRDGWCKIYSGKYSYGTNKFTKTKYSKSGYDITGYDKNGFDKYGLHKFTKDYYDKDGYDKDGFNKNGWNRYDINKYTGTFYDKHGYNRWGEDDNGFNRDGINRDGMDKRGFFHIRDSNDLGYGGYDGGNNYYTGTMYDKNGLDYFWRPENINENTVKFRKKTIKICSIASGSNGNCYYIGTDDEAILIDDGISYRQLLSRMKEVNLDINSVKGIFISHEHSDHIYGLPIFYKNHPNVPIYFNEKAYSSVKYKYDPGSYKKGVVNLEDKVVKLGGFKIYPFKKRHDASYPLSFRIEYNGISVGVFTDIGESSTKFQNHFSKCNAVFLESNHDVTMLKNGPYDTYLRQRVYETHFSNDDAYNMLKKYANPNLQVVVLVHISEKNNTIKEVEEKFKKFRKKYKIEIASRHAVGEVHEILINN